MAQEIARLSKSEVLNINEDEYIDYLENKFSLTPIKVYRDMEEIREPRKIQREMQCDPYTATMYGYRQNSRVVYEGYEIKVSYPFEGDAVLFLFDQIHSQSEVLLQNKSTLMRAQGGLY